MRKKVTPPSLKYKSFNETYKWCSFCMALGLVYPNKQNVKRRLMLFASLVVFHTFTLFWFIYYLIKCIVQLDIYNTTRTITVAIVIGLYFFKIIYACWKTDVFEDILKQISKDLLKGNYVEKEYHEIYDNYIKLATYGQMAYLIIPGLMSLEYPVYALVAMAYGSMKSDTYQKYMVHDMDLKFMESKQYDFPYFELIFAYYTTACLILIPSFAGFDGSFCIATSHLCMKLKLMSLRVQRTMKYSKSVFELKSRLKDCIKDHQEALVFYGLLQRMYGGWLLAIFLVTSFMISCNLYQIHVTGIDPKYTMFAISGVFHMYVPCYFASCLIEVGDEISDEIYCSDWECWADPSTTKMLVFMIARAQKKLILSGQGIVTFKMETFVSLMQTSYSFYTLITSEK